MVVAGAVGARFQPLETIAEDALPERHRAPQQITYSALWWRLTIPDRLLVPSPPPPFCGGPAGKESPCEAIGSSVRRPQYIGRKKTS